MNNTGFKVVLLVGACNNARRVWDDGVAVVTSLLVDDAKSVVVCLPLTFRPEIRRDYPLNLSILLSGGEENNNDSPSNCE